MVGEESKICFNPVFIFISQKVLQNDCHSQKKKASTIKSQVSNPLCPGWEPEPKERVFSQVHMPSGESTPRPPSWWDEKIPGISLYHQPINCARTAVADKKPQGWWVANKSSVLWQWTDKHCGQWNSVFLACSFCLSSQEHISSVCEKIWQQVPDTCVESYFQMIEGQSELLTTN